MHRGHILQELRTRGQMLDLEISAATGIPLAEVRVLLAEMSARGEVMGCTLTRYVDGQPVEALQYRVSGFIPRPAPGRKPGKKTP